MATELDGVFVPLALDLINTYGKSVHAAISNDGVYDPTAGNMQSPTTQYYPIKISPPSPKTASFSPSDVDISGMMTAYVAASGLAFTPVPGMKIIFDKGLSSEDSWGAHSVLPIYSGELIAVWKLDLSQ
jgi:hypothetical protein